MELFKSVKKGCQKSRRKTEEFFRILFGRDLSGEEERLASKKWRKTLLLASLSAGVSYLFSLATLPFGITSLGYAFFAAAVGSEAIFSLFGILLSLFSHSAPFVTLFVISLGILMRVLIKKTAVSAKYFEESRRVRCALATSLAFLYSFAEAALIGFPKDALTSLLTATLAAPILTFLFSLITKPAKEGAWRELGRLTVVFFLVYALNTVGILGLSLGVMLGFFLTLSIAITNGSLRGVLMGLVSGLAIGGIYSPIFALAGLITGLLANLHLTAAVLASSAAAIGLGIYLEGPIAVLSFSGDVLLATALFLPLAKAGLIPQIHFFADEPSELPGMKYVEDLQRKFRQNRLEALATAFEELSDVFLELSEKSRHPQSYELEEASDAVFSRYCKKCALQNICWQRDYTETSEAVSVIFKKVKEGGVLDSTDLPDTFGKRCRHLEKILRDINNAAADLVERAIRRDKTELFALDYEAMAELLAETAREGEDEFECDRALTKKAMHALRQRDFSALGYSAFGKRQKTVVASGVDITSLSLSGKEITKTLADATELDFAEPRFDFSGDFVTMSVKTLPKLTLEVASRTRAKDDALVSGDASTHFEDAVGTPYLLLCDGMGSGRAAAITARISTVFLEKMISAGNKQSVVLKMLSNFLRSKSEECHSTCDLLEIDTYTCRAHFTKCGAAPSYLYRDGKLITLDLRSLPIGITRDFTPAQESIDLSVDDILILTSDGIGTECASLLEILKEKEAAPIDELAEALLNALATDDDATVLATRILPYR